MGIVVRSGRRRALGSMIAAFAAVFVITQTALAATSWASPQIVGTTHTYNEGNSLARSVTSTTSYLHSVFTNSYPGGVAATDTGPYAGAYYSRGNSSGTSWGTAKRLNLSTEHATSTAVVASGSAIYAAYVTLGHWVNYDPAESRHVVVRINSNHGSSSAWLSRRVDFSLTDRVDRPAMAPWSTRGFLITFTDADTGDIMIITCGDLTIEESGCFGGTAGTTTRLAADPADGFEGLPVVAASGTTLAVAWLNGDGGVTARTKSGNTWAAEKVLTTAASDGLAATAKSTRFAFSWADNAGVKVRLWNAGVWKATHTVATVSSTGTWKFAYTTAVALAGTATVGVAWAACRKADCSASSTTGVDLRWRESADNAVSWKTAVTVASYTAASTRRFNDFPSVLMSSTTKRFVMYNTMSSGGGSYRVWLRVGTG